MRRLIVALSALAVLLLNISSFSISRNDYDSGLYKVLDPSILIRIKATRNIGEGIIHPGWGNCSGTYVAEGTILTANHCFEPPEGVTIKEIWVKDSYNKSYRAKVIKLDRKNDLALIAVSVHDNPVAKIAKGPLKVGKEVIAVGSPLGFEFLVSKGILIGLHQGPRELNGKFTLHSALINPGSSGGGLFDAATGELIGVNVRIVATNPFGGSAGISMSVPLEDIQNFLK